MAIHVLPGIMLCRTALDSCICMLASLRYSPLCTFHTATHTNRRAGFVATYLEAACSITETLARLHFMPNAGMHLLA